MLYVTGDIHGEPISRWSFRSRPETRNLTTNDIMIQLGDFGVLFNPNQVKQTLYDLRWINNKPWTTLVVRGNHDNPDMWKQCPIVEKWGGYVRQCSFNGETFSRIFLVNEPTILDLPNSNKIEHCLLIPGADSHDIDYLLDPSDKSFKRTARKLRQENKFYRVIGKNWWPNEKVDIDAIRALLNNHKEHFDFIFTHDYPDKLNQERAHFILPFRLEGTDTQKYFEELRETIDFGSWYHGHFHIDAKLISDERVIGVYYNIICLGE